MRRVALVILLPLIGAGCLLQDLTIGTYGQNIPRMLTPKNDGRCKLFEACDLKAKSNPSDSSSSKQSFADMSAQEMCEEIGLEIGLAPTTSDFKKCVMRLMD